MLSTRMSSLVFLLSLLALNCKTTERKKLRQPAASSPKTATANNSYALNVADLTAPSIQLTTLSVGTATMPQFTFNATPEPHHYSYKVCPLTEDGPASTESCLTGKLYWGARALPGLKPGSYEISSSPCLKTAEGAPAVCGPSARVVYQQEAKPDQKLEKLLVNEQNLSDKIRSYGKEVWENLSAYQQSHLPQKNATTEFDQAVLQQLEQGSGVSGELLASPYLPNFYETLQAAEEAAKQKLSASSSQTSTSEETLQGEDLEDLKKRLAALEKKGDKNSSSTSGMIMISLGTTAALTGAILLGTSVLIDPSTKLIKNGLDSSANNLLDQAFERINGVTQGLIGYVEIMRPEDIAGPNFINNPSNNAVVDVDGYKSKFILFNNNAAHDATQRKTIYQITPLEDNDFIKKHLNNSQVWNLSETNPKITVIDEKKYVKIDNTVYTLDEKYTVEGNAVYRGENKFPEYKNSFPVLTQDTISRFENRKKILIEGGEKADIVYNTFEVTKNTQDYNKNILPSDWGRGILMEAEVTLPNGEKIIKVVEPPTAWKKVGLNWFEDPPPFGRQLNDMLASFHQGILGNNVVSNVLTAFSTASTSVVTETKVKSSDTIEPIDDGGMKIARDNGALISFNKNNPDLIQKAPPPAQYQNQSSALKTLGIQSEIELAAWNTSIDLQSTKNALKSTITSTTKASATAEAPKGIDAYRYKAKLGFGGAGSALILLGVAAISSVTALNLADSPEGSLLQKLAAIEQKVRSLHAQKLKILQQIKTHLNEPELGGEWIYTL